MSLISNCAKNLRRQGGEESGNCLVYREKEEFTSIRGLIRIMRTAGTIVGKAGIKRLKQV